MAAIDKIYVDKFEDYLLFKEWCKKQQRIKDKYGDECSISDYLYQWESFENDKSYPIFNAPCYIDAYLIRNCPFEFIQDQLKFNYGYKSQEWIDDSYNTVMNRNNDTLIIAGSTDSILKPDEISYSLNNHIDNISDITL